MKTNLLLILSVLVLSGCANVASTRLLFKSENSTLVVDMPKEVETKKLKVIFNEKQGTIQITADSWTSRNTETIASQAVREKAVLESSAALVEKVSEGVTRGAIKGMKP